MSVTRHTRHIYLVHKKNDARFITLFTKKGDSLNTLFIESELEGAYIREESETVIKAVAFLKDQIKTAIQEKQDIGLMLEFNLGYTGCDVSVVDVFLKVLNESSCPLKYIYLTGNGNSAGGFGIPVKIDETTWVTRDLNEQEQNLGIKNASRAQVNIQLNELKNLQKLPFYQSTEIAMLKPKADYKRLELVRTKSLPDTKLIEIPPKTMRSDPSSPTKVRNADSKSVQGPVPRNLFGNSLEDAKVGKLAEDANVFQFKVPQLSPDSGLFTPDSATSATRSPDSELPTPPDIATPASGNSSDPLVSPSPDSQSSSADVLNTLKGVKPLNPLPLSVVSQDTDQRGVRLLDPLPPSVVPQSTDQKVPGLSRLRLSGAKVPEAEVEKENNEPKTSVSLKNSQSSD